MGWWSKAKHAVHKATKAVSHAVKKAVNTVTETASDIAESAGNAVESGINWVADQAGKIPGIGGALQAVGHYLGNIVGAATDFVATTIKAAGGLLGTGLAGAIEIGVGILTLDGPLIKDGFLDIVSGIVAAVVLVVLKAVAVIQSLIPGLAQRRPLTEAEKKMLHKVFRDSVALANVRIVEGRWSAGVFGWGDPDRPWTVGNVIYFKAVDPDDEPYTLVHEVTHVWQYQNDGSEYMGDAIGAQIVVPEPYDWERELRRGHTEWTQFNREAQAELIEDIWVYGGLIAVSPVPGGTTSPGKVPAPVGSGEDKPGQGQGKGHDKGHDKGHGHGHSHGHGHGHDEDAARDRGMAAAYTPLLSGTSAAPVSTPIAIGNGSFYEADRINTVGVFPADVTVFSPYGVYTALANRTVDTLRAPVSARFSSGWS